MKPPYPSFDILSLHTDEVFKDLISIELFGGYYDKNPHLQSLHTHSFYHMAYFSKGTGSHIIDFNEYIIQEGMLYFMKPGQVHQWHFTSEADGMVINFSPLFFDKLHIDSQVLKQFPVFHNPSFQILDLNREETKPLILSLFESIIHEKNGNELFSHLVIAGHLLNIFSLASRKAGSGIARADHSYEYRVFRRFEEEVDAHYVLKKLPGEYALLLHVTPHYLNRVSNKFAGIPAGAFIRNRVLLEAKRLLINFSMTVREVAYELQFSDPSHFNKFFKKNEGVTAEQFRMRYKKS